MRYFSTELAFHEFKKVFSNEEACLNYLMKTKWKNGFECPRCGNHKHCQGRTKFHCQCTRCKYQDSPTSHTIFHRVRFPLNKAFSIVFFMLKSNKRVTSTELSQKIGLRQKTCWFFQEKIRHKLTEGDYQELMKILEYAESYIFQKEPITRGHQSLQQGNQKSASASSTNRKRPALGALSEE